MPQANKRKNRRRKDRRIATSNLPPVSPEPVPIRRAPVINLSPDAPEFIPRRTIPVISNLSPYAPEFIPASSVANSESNTENQRDNLQLQPIGNDCNSTNSDATNNSKTAVSTNKGQRDLLIDLLNNANFYCVICEDRITNEDPIWNCRSCFQILHLKCIMVWVIKSHTNHTWRCPLCQSNVVGKPTYRCFCGALSLPFSNNMNTPHSCGQVCGLEKKNFNKEYDCQHKCRLLCHPGPCPRCVEYVWRYCGCGKKTNYVQCGQSTPILCQNTCSKPLSCKSHICEQKCHLGNCGPCKKCREQLSQSVIPHTSPQRTSVPNVPAQEVFVTVVELRMLGLNPQDLFPGMENQNTFYL